MSLREKLIQAVAEVLEAAVPAAAPHVYLSAVHDNDHEPRPAIPYITLAILNPGVTIGMDEVRDGVDGGGAPTRWVSGLREGTIEIHGWGDDTSDWLMAFDQALHLPAQLDQMETLGVTILNSEGGPIEASVKRNTGFESHFVQDHRLRYRYTSDPVTQTELLNVDLSLTIHETEQLADDPDPLVVTSTVLSPPSP